MEAVANLFALQECTEIRTSTGALNVAVTAQHVALIQYALLVKE